MIISKDLADVLVQKMINDKKIDDDEWERKYQHIRDDICFYRDKYGYVDIDKVANFHGNIIYTLIKRYGI